MNLKLLLISLGLELLLVSFLSFFFFLQNDFSRYVIENVLRNILIVLKIGNNPNVHQQESDWIKYVKCIQENIMQL